MAHVDLEDLKQLLEAGFARSEERLTSKLTDVIYVAVTASENRLRAEMQEGFATIADIITAMNGRMDKNSANHERRIHRLEKHTRLPVLRKGAPNATR
jgi:hypothetical protein